MNNNTTNEEQKLPSKHCIIADGTVVYEAEGDEKAREAMNVYLKASSAHKKITYSIDGVVVIAGQRLPS